MKYLEMLKNQNDPVEELSKLSKVQEQKISDELHSKFNILLYEVGAYIRHDHDGTALVFDPPLEGKKADPKRWAYALELEQLFFQLDINNHVSSKKSLCYENGKDPPQ